jgi:hypothetical protein
LEPRQTEKNRNFDWMAALFYPLAVVLMEAFWVSPWLNWLGVWPVFREPRPVLSLTSVVIVLLISLVATRLITRKNWPLGVMQFTIVGLGVLMMLFVLAFEYNDGYTFLSGGWFGHIGGMLGVTFSHASTIVIAIPVMIYLWWRGIRLGQTTSIFSSVYRSFLIGLVALIALIILWQATSASGQFRSPGQGLGWNVIAFFFFGLMAVAICHLYVMRSTMPKEEAALTSIKRWLPVMLIVIGGMVVIGFGVASIFSPEFFNTIGNAAKTAGDALGTAFEFILRLFNFVFEAILWILRWIISRLRTNPLEQDGQSGNVSTNPFPQVTPNNWPSAVTETIKWTMLTLIIAAVVYILIRAISRFRDRRARDEIEEIHESLFSWRGLRKDLRELLNMMGKRFQRKEAASAKYHFNESDQGMMDIREIYRHMQWEGGKSGIPRRRHETTGEYQSRLRRRLPEGSEQLEDIVRSYDSVRYGDEKLIDKEYISTNNGWKVIRNLLWRLRGY